MARKTSKFMIGLFVILGALIGVSAMVWVGASKYFQKGTTYVTYFDESVQGLQMDSSVKYLGVEVGRVAKIRVAPDDRLIEVVMKIDMKGDLERDTVAELKAVGLTGLVFVELDRKGPGEPDLSPKLSFTSDFPVIPSRPSEIKKLLTAVDEIIEKIKQIDTKGISDQIKSTTREIETFVSGIKLDKIIARAESTLGHLDQIATRVDDALAAGKLEEVLVEVKKTLVDAQKLIAEINQEVHSMNLPQTMENTASHLDKTISKISQSVDGVTKRAYAIENDLKATSENLKRSSENLDRLIERIHDSPSDLLFGQPPPPRRKR
ncbi:MAG: MCE family protein [Syntrophaceae bacterium]|nr:MCE family protein [Syntrophaceae bacterium]